MPHEQFDFSAQFQDLLLACVIKHPDDFAIYSSVLAPSQFIGVLATHTAKAVFSHFTKFHRFPSWEALEQIVTDEQTRLNNNTPNPEEHDRAKRYIRALSELDTGDHEYVKERVVRFARERAMLAAIRQSIDDIQSGKQPEDGFIERFEKVLRIGKDINDLGLIFHQDFRRVIEQVTSSTYGIKTGYTFLDNIWKNGWAPGWLIVFLAPPKRYKSTICLNLALNITGPTIGGNVFYYSCEISSELALTRSVCRISGQSMDDMYKDPVAFADNAEIQINRLSAGYLMFKHYPAKTATILDIKAHAEMVRSQLGISPSAIIIDYAETIRPINTDASEHQQHASIYTDARALGEHFKCPVIMPDRCNKETVDRRVPNVKSFQGAFQKGGIVDAAIGICATDGEYANNDIRLFVFINRHGPAYQHFRGKVDPEHMDIELIEQIKFEEDDMHEDIGKRKRKSSSSNDHQRRLPDEIQDD